MKSNNALLDELDWETLGEAIPDLVSIHDADFRILWANHIFFNKLGIRLEDLLGRKCYELVHHTKVPWPNCPHGRSILTGKSTRTEVNIGKEVYLISCAPIIIDGAALGSVHTAKDITELKTAEKELKIYAQELEHSNQIKDLFTDIMRHDLLNPASIIKGMTEILLVESSGRKELHVLKRHADRLIEMIQSASRLSKLESIDELEKQRLDLKELIDDAVENCKHLFREAGMQIINKSEDNVTFKANPVIVDVFLNLLANASKYAAEGKKVLIETEKDKGSITVMVKDYGPGIPDGEKEKIFDRFSRREKGVVKGTGLGLAIAKRIVELHGGSIRVEDNKPQGSIFIVELPKSP